MAGPFQARRERLSEHVIICVYHIVPVPLCARALLTRPLAFAIMEGMNRPASRSLAFALAAALAATSGCVMKRTVTQGGAVVSQGYVVERPLETLHNLETTGPDEDDD
jgi:hypothetical protein